jgi:electron transport complex protein RnfD
MKKFFKTSSSPHIHINTRTNHLMLDVIIALLPALIVSVVLFGTRTLLVVGVTVLSCVLLEFLYQKLTKQPVTIKDLSAVVTGMLLAFNYPVNFPLWQAVIGAAVAMILLKQFFGGVGRNLINPAMGARAVLVVLFSIPLAGQLQPLVRLPYDVFTGATPLNLMANGLWDFSPDYWQLFLGMRAGSLGETSKAALLIGGIYLIYKRVISPLIPVTYIATVFVLSALLGSDPIFAVLTGGLFLGAFFMAVDYTTCPMTKNGKFIYALGLGIITVLIRQFGVFSEGVAFSIVTMNLLTPLIERYTQPKVFGVEVGDK